MEANGGSAGVEGAGIGSYDALTKQGRLQALVAEVVLDHFGHGPVEEDGAGFGVASESLFDIRPGGSVADPDVAVSCGAKRITEAADDVAHGVPAIDVVGGELEHSLGATFVVIPELNRRAIEERDEQPVDGRSPLETTAGQLKLFDDERMQQAGEVGTRGHANARKGLLDGARATDAGPALNDEDALAGASEISSAGESVVPGADDDGVPCFGREFANRDRQADFAED